MKISLSMITKPDEWQMLDRCLESTGGIFDEIVVVATYKGKRPRVRNFGRTAKRHKARVEWFEWVDDFAAARNRSFALAVHPWRFWLDTDDTLSDAEALPEVLGTLDPERWPLPQVALAMPYYYGHDEYGNPVTILTRTRAVWWPHGWRWVRRVHEDLQPRRPVDLAKTADIGVVHRPAPVEEGTDPPAARNLRILLQELEDDPGDLRTIQYLGHQYFALHDWEQAAESYRTFLEAAPRTIEAWQAWHFLALAYRNMERHNEAAAAEFQAIQLAPHLADPYYGLMAVAVEVGLYAEALHWLEVARSAQRPPADAPIFYNPMEYEYNPVLFSHRAYAKLGQFSQAIAEIDRGLRLRPEDQYLLSQRAQIVDLQEKQRLALSWAAVARRAREGDRAKGTKARGKAALALAKEIGPEVLTGFDGSRGELQELEHRLTLGHPQRARPRVVIFCGQSVEPFGPVRVETEGLGGSEAAVVYVAQELAQLGAQVLVYNEPGEEWGAQGYVDGVSWWPWQLYDPAEVSCDLFVAWRRPELAAAIPRKCGASWLWMHDLHAGGEFTPERIEAFDLVRPVSNWAGDYLRMVYPWLKEGQVIATANGRDPQVELRDPAWIESGPRGQRLIWTSSPDRGLDNLLRAWPDILRVAPDARLHVYYGWEVYDRAMNQRGSPAIMARFKREVEHLAKQPGVIWHGRVGRAELADAWARADVWAYPTEFLEVSCITAMNAAASGVAILTSHHGAIPETLGEVGYKLRGPAGGVHYQARFTGYLVNILTDPDEWRRAAAGGPAQAAGKTWAAVAAEWMERGGLK